MFSTIERLHHSVTSAGNPIEMDLKTRYVVKGVGTEKVIDSKIVIDYNESTGRITRLQDRWSGDIPTSSFAEVSVMRLLSPWWWLQSVEAVGFWLLTLVWETRLAQVRRVSQALHRAIEPTRGANRLVNRLCASSTRIRCRTSSRCRRTTRRMLRGCGNRRSRAMGFFSIPLINA